jgi:hypothetical protein
VSCRDVHCVVAACVLLITCANVLALSRLPVRADVAGFKCHFVMEDSSSVSGDHLTHVCSKGSYTSPGCMRLAGRGL